MEADLLLLQVILNSSFNQPSKYFDNNERRGVMLSTDNINSENQLFLEKK